MLLCWLWHVIGKSSSPKTLTGLFLSQIQSRTSTWVALLNPTVPEISVWTSVKQVISHTGCY